MLNTETDFQTNLGWEESLAEFETEVLSDIINPVENYETVRYIHKPYTSSGVTQTDIWFYFYFLSGSTYVQDYTPQDISSRENELMLKQSTESFFRLEFYKTPGVVNGNTLSCEPPTRVNRKLVFSRNLSLPLGEKMFYNTLNGYVHLPVFNGNNYRNKENMYLFWFDDETAFLSTQGDYDNCIAAHPYIEDEVFVGGVGMWKLKFNGETTTSDPIMMFYIFNNI